MPVPGQHVNLAQNRPSPTSPVPLIHRVWLRCLGVFADESIEDRSSSHPCRGKIRDQWRGRVGGRWEQLSCLVRPVRVAVGDALAQRGEQVAFNVDEGLIRAEGCHFTDQRVQPSGPLDRREPHSWPDRQTMVRIWRAPGQLDARSGTSGPVARFRSRRRRCWRERARHRAGG